MTITIAMTSTLNVKIGMTFNGIYCLGLNKQILRID